MSEQTYIGKIEELPNVTNGHFIENSVKKVVFGPDRFWPDYVMRCFILQPGAGSESHAHPWPHYAVLIKGQGVFQIDGVATPIEAGSYIHVPGGLSHNFWNTSETEEFTLLCIVPRIGDVNPLAGKGC